MDLDELLQKWNELISQSIDKDAINEYKNFNDWIEKNPLNQLKLENYTNLRELGQEYFTHWLERKTEACGKFRTASSYAYGVYRHKHSVDATPKYRYVKQRNTDINEKEAEEYFYEQVKPILVKLSTLEDVGQAESPLEINFSRKVAYMFNPDKLLPIYKNSTIKTAADFFGLKDIDLKNYKSTEKVLNLIKEKFGITDENYSLDKKFELTQRLGKLLFDNFGQEEINESDTVRKYWKFSPGENARYWNEMCKQGIASIGFALDFPIKGNSLEQANNQQRDASKVFQEAKPGDMIFAFKGVKELIGYGTINKTTLYNKQEIIKGSGHYNYHEVEWTALSPSVKLERGVVQDTFADLTRRREEFLRLIKSLTINAKEDKIMPNSLNIILYGPPGTGKTFNTVAEALKILEGDKYLKNDYKEQKKRFDVFKDSGRIEFVTFHQSFSYEDFVEGIRAKTTDDGKVSYVVEDGVFKALAIKAKENIEQSYVLIIDEINRGNISRIFGELITLIEPSKRLGTDEALAVKLPYSKDKNKEDFGVPLNLYIIGTMNTSDRSLALMDTALRRRFDFIEMMPDTVLLDSVVVDGVNIKTMLETINNRIEALYDREHMIGHAFFMSLKNESDIEDLAHIFRNKILPLLEEYFFEDWEKITKVLGNSKIYITKDWASLGHGFTGSSYSRNNTVLNDAQTYINIYDTTAIQDLV